MKKQWFATVAAVLTATTALLVLLCLMGRASPDVPRPALAAPLQITPTVTLVDPSSAPNDLDTSIVITGTGFSAGLSGTLVITHPAVYLGPTSLDDMGWVSSATLTATVPWGLEPGVYTLTVVNPDGESGSLPNAFTVTQGIGVWTTGGPYGGNIENLVIHPMTPTQIYASAFMAGLFHSDDAAAHWQPMLIDPMPTRLAIDPGLPQVMYIGGANDHFRTEDDGATWERAVPPGVPTHQHPYDFHPVTHPTLSGTVYLGASGTPGVDEGGGLYRSSDRGVTWVTMTVGLTDTNVMAVAFNPDNPDTMYLGTRGGDVYTSTNAGSSWAWAAHIAPHIERLVVNPFGAHEVWAVVFLHSYSGQTTWGVFRSLNVSLTAWEQIAIDGEARVSSLAFHPTISGTIWAATGYAYVSTDGGQTWSPAGSGLPGTVEDLAVDPHNPNVMYAGTMQGVFKSTDSGNAWNEMNQGLTGIVPEALAVSPADPDEVYAATGHLGVVRSDNGGRSWQRLDVPAAVCGWHSDALAVDPVSPTRVYVGASESDDLCIQISDDHGQTWHAVTLTIPVTLTGWSGQTNIVAPHPARAGEMLAGVTFHPPSDGSMQGGLYASHDYGEHWTCLDVGQPISPVTALAYDPVDPLVVYIGTTGYADAGFTAGSGLLKSNDGGATWQTILSGPGIDAILSVAVHPQDHNTVYVSTMGLEQSVQVSMNAGQTWAPLPEQPTSSPVWVLLFAPTEPPTLYAGTMTDGLQRSTDSGQTWTRAAGMPGNANVPSLAAGTDGERVVVYVGTSGGAVWSEALAGAGIVQASPGDTLIGAGVYRMTTRILQVYLPLIFKGYAP